MSICSSAIYVIVHAFLFSLCQARNLAEFDLISAAHLDHDSRNGIIYSTSRQYVGFIMPCHLLQLKDLVKQLLGKQRLSHGDVHTSGTPRRLVVRLDFFLIVLLNFSSLYSVK